MSALWLLGFAWGADTVVGGEVVGPGRWDDAAVILDNFDVGYCTGTLIASDWVLTAGHCLVGNTPSAVVLGTKNWGVADGGVTIPVEEEVVYPASGATFDLGLLRLSTPSSIAPRTIARDCVAEQDLVDGAPAWIVGFGATDEAGLSFQTYLNEAATTIADADCSETYVDGDFLSGCRGDDVNPGGELGAGGGGIDACFGDSGGPLYLESSRGVFLAGVTSRSYLGVDAALPCTSGGIWVRPDAVLDWIESYTGPLARPTCNHEPIASAPPLIVRGGRGVTQITVADDDSFSFRFGLLDIDHGEIEFGDDGTVTYYAGKTFEGTDEVIVRVIDDGSMLWPESDDAYTRLVIPVSGRAGCAATTAPWGFALFAAPFVRRRGTIRRR